MDETFLTQKKWLSRSLVLFLSVLKMNQLRLNVSLKHDAQLTPWAPSKTWEPATFSMSQGGRRGDLSVPVGEEGLSSLSWCWSPHRHIQPVPWPIFPAAVSTTPASAFRSWPLALWLHFRAKVPECTVDQKCSPPPQLLASRFYLVLTLKSTGRGGESTMGYDLFGPWRFQALLLPDPWVFPPPCL